MPGQVTTMLDTPEPATGDLRELLPRHPLSRPGARGDMPYGAGLEYTRQLLEYWILTGERRWRRSSTPSRNIEPHFGHCAVDFIAK